MAIFSIFILGSVGSFVAITKLHQRSIEERKALESARLFVDDLTRAAQVADPSKLTTDGTTVFAPNTCSDSISFVNHYVTFGGSNAYRLDQGAIVIDTGSGTQNVTDSPSNGAGFMVVGYPESPADPNDANIPSCAAKNDGTYPIFKLVQSTKSTAGQEYLRIRFRMVPASNGNGSSFQINSPKGIVVETTINIRTGEN